MNKIKLILRLFIVMLLCSNAYAEFLVADISAQTLIKGVDFHGREISISGITDDNTQLLATIKGPLKNYRLSQKKKSYGLWTINDQHTFKGVHSYFFLAASSNMIEGLSPKIMQTIGIDKTHGVMPYVALSKNEGDYPFYSELVRLKEGAKMYLLKGNEIERVGSNIFRIHAFLPIKANLGDYEVSIYRLEKGEIIDEVKLKFNLDNHGFDQAINELAQTKPLRHGLLAVIIALFSGALVGFLFRRQV